MKSIAVTLTGIIWGICAICEYTDTIITNSWLGMAIISSIMLSTIEDK
jgi:hypothetical protein